MPEMDTVEIRVTEEELEQEAEIISIRTAKLLKFRHDIKQLRAKLSNGFSKGLKECKDTCKVADTLIEELNDNIEQEGSRDN